jgi:L-threonylcarbamoyladenylate synthase
MVSAPERIKEAARLLTAGKLVAFPTETVYGLGGDATGDQAVAAIYAAKGRPQFNPLIVHVHSPEQAQGYAQFNDAALALAAHFWPGPLTLVLPRRSDCPISLLVSAGMDTLAIRMPAHTLAQALLRECNLPLAAPSANRSGRISPTRAQHVQDDLGDRIAMVLDGGECRVGIESTVVSLAYGAPVILRPGSVAPEALSAVLNTQVGYHESGGILAPGMLASHYAPSTRMRLNATSVSADEALLAFGADVPGGASHTLNLSAGGSLREAAANLFAMLRQLDAAGAATIAVMPIAQTGPDAALAYAINDRLSRAAAPR